MNWVEMEMFVESSGIVVDYWMICPATEKVRMVPSLFVGRNLRIAAAVLMVPSAAAVVAAVEIAPFVPH